MYLSKLVIDPTSREFRRDYADVREMHRTVMSAFGEVANDEPARQAHAVLWRLDNAQRGFTQYVQSGSEPDWSRLPSGYVSGAPEVRSMQPVLDAIAPGRRFAFRLVANPTRTIARVDAPPRLDGKRPQGRKVPLRKPDDQVCWLVRQAERCGFIIPTGANGQPDLAPSPCPTSTGRRRAGDAGSITVEPVRFEGHLVVIDTALFTTAIRDGIGRAKAYGCGMISLAPARTPT
ncbi:type I-E CRISPR-associated protein Cas6/Cse3/CasE [Dactylosporangium fulvum]|uniref:Type I-E CRISPR-associated protein Cas6/Cse3/CasE n=1 Tax=Dactylosporangium fulvum TaxID=53359 RepID=A0ABY5VVH8_9ACTN|nr:type I-E CRISPR-associated protein Cas6/Cse3/CasE [Dactylosporangium fulvum]UWP81270.1 type I-E CRISPR-associated protein Cas6/Cse3/CasE [Dactylosporangium fulvum]